VALAAQGFLDSAPTGRVDVRHFRRVLGRVGVVQLDSVSVVSRTHYLPFFSRLGPYDRGALDQWLNGSGEAYEYWAHEASSLPVERYPLFAFRRESVRPWHRVEALLAEHPGYVEAVYQEVVDRGPLKVSDLENPGERTGAWWGYGAGKIALEWLFVTGRITANRTTAFTRCYDLPERRLPAPILEAPEPDRHEAYRQLLLLAVEHHGVGTVRDLADYYRLHVPTARTILAELAGEGAISHVEVAGWRGPVYLDPAARLPRRATPTALLSPFDSLVWERERTERLFGFRYRIEIYVPKEKRVFGYYVLPFLLDGELAARVDLKTDRSTRRLQVRSAHHESEQDHRRVASVLAAELRSLAGWLGLTDVDVERSGNLADTLARSVG
jgi:hypothetical protein